jgi:hypothetical protein
VRAHGWAGEGGVGSPNPMPILADHRPKPMEEARSLVLGHRGAYVEMMAHYAEIAARYVKLRVIVSKNEPFRK